MSEGVWRGKIFNLARELARSDSPPNALICNPSTLERLGLVGPHEELTIGQYKLKVIPEKFAPPGMIYLIAHPYLEQLPAAMEKG